MNEKFELNSFKEDKMNIGEFDSRSIITNNNSNDKNICIFNDSKKIKDFSLDLKEFFENPTEQEEEDSKNLFELPNKIKIKSTSLVSSNLPNSQEISEIMEKEPKEKQKKFITFLYHKRGRKTFQKKKRLVHGANDFDNIQRKIQVKFLSFLIGLANDAINSVLGDKSPIKFKGIDYFLKKTISQNSIENMKRLSYSDILQMKISSKYKLFNKDHNKKCYLQLCRKSQVLKHFFEQNYLKIFQNYYYNHEEPLKEIFFEGVKIVFSQKTKNFYFLLKSNPEIKEVLLKGVRDVYFCKINYLAPLTFLVKKD